MTFFVVSTNENYHGPIVGHDCIARANTIGHEIHITRPIVLFLFDKKLINNDDVIVTKNNERFFLYSLIFKNVIDYSSLPSDADVIYVTDLNTYHEEKNILFVTEIEKKDSTKRNIFFIGILIKKRARI